MLPFVLYFKACMDTIIPLHFIFAPVKLNVYTLKFGKKITFLFFFLKMPVKH